jgi:hypothetical protein
MRTNDSTDTDLPTHRIAVTIAGLLALMVTASCGKRVPNYRDTKYAPAVVEGRELRVADEARFRGPLVIEAEWIVLGDRYCVEDSTMSIVTPAGNVDLFHANACVTTEPFSLIGEAEVPFPALGYLADVGVESERPRAKIAMGLGHQLGTIEIAGEPMELDPKTFYLSAEYDAGLQASLGTAALVTPVSGARMVIAPQDPMIYIAASIGGVTESVGLAFSADGRIPYVPQLPLYDGTDFSRQRFDGHFMARGMLPLHPYPFTINGSTLYDIDGDDDGKTIFNGDVDDLVVAADGTLSFGYGKGGFGISVELGEASATYDHRTKVASFSARNAGGLFEGTPLEVIQLTKTDAMVHGMYRSMDDFKVTASLDSTVMAGFAVSNTELVMTQHGVTAAGTVDIAGLGTAEMMGHVFSNGTFDLQGTANLKVAGFEMAGARVSLGNNGIHVAGQVALPGVGHVAVSGAIKPDATFALTGTANLSPAGLSLVNANVTITTQRAEITGSVGYLGTGFSVSGHAAHNGTFDLRGSITLDLEILRGEIALWITEERVGASAIGEACIGEACVALGGMALDSSGRVCPTFPIIGQECIDLL